MARKRSPTNVVCQNPQCEFHFKKHGKDIVKRGKDARSGCQRYYCKHCRKTFYIISEVLISRPKCVKDNELIKILGMIRELRTMRRIAQDTEHHADTIKKLFDALKEQEPELFTFMTNDLRYPTDDCIYIINFLKTRIHSRNKQKIIKSRVKKTLSRESGSRYYARISKGAKRGRPPKIRI